MPTPAQNIILFGQPRPAVLMDFQSGRYQLGTQSFSSLLAMTGATFSRASAGNALNSAGTIVSFGSGVPRITDLGLLIEEARTNLFLNSFAPVTQTITLGATGNYTTSVWGTGSVAVAAGTATITGAGSAAAGSPVTINCTGTGTITLTVTGSPTAVNFEAGAFGTSPITTTGSTATRAADVASIGGLSLSAATIAVMATPGAADSTFRRAASLNDGTTSNEAYIGIASGNGKGFVFAGGVQQAGFNGSAWTGSQRAALSYAAGAQAISFFGGAVTTATGASAPTATHLDIGNVAGSAWFDGYIQRVTVYAPPLSNSQLQALTQ